MSDVKPQLLTTEEAAKELNLSAITLRKLRCKGKLKTHIPPVPFIELGRTIRYDRDDLRAYIAKHRNSGNSAV